jgi:two-component system alkaline phosphatase synthesis response regulator PhoP
MKNLPYKILVVDDEAMVLNIIETAFNTNDHRILTAGNIEDAEKLLKQDRPDLLILDRMLPDGDGLQLCAKLRNDPEYRSIPVLMLTGKSDTSDKVLGLKLGADDYLSKPFEITELKARVEALLRRTEDLNSARSLRKSLWRY